MSRDISTTNQAEIDAAHLHEVVLAKFEFDTPIYVHSGIGTITYDSNDYLGVGDFGAVSSAKESETLGPNPVTLTLSGVDPEFFNEALDSGNYRDPITLYLGYRQDDGTLVDDPITLWKGWYEYAGIVRGAENAITITAQHDLTVLDEKDGSRFNDEDQNERYAGDVFFEFISDQAVIKLKWAGGPLFVPREGPPPDDPSGPPKYPDLPGY